MFFRGNNSILLIIQLFNYSKLSFVFLSFHKIGGARE